MDPTTIFLYYLSWQVPSSTVVYIYLKEKLLWKRIPAYFIGNIVAATIMYPIQNYIFK